MKTTTTRAAVAVLGTASLLLTGCGNRTQVAAESPAKTKEYITVTSMGSWIPRKVKNQGDIIGDQTGVTDSELLERARRNTVPVKDPEQGMR